VIPNSELAALRAVPELHVPEDLCAALERWGTAGLEVGERESLNWETVKPEFLRSDGWLKFCREARRHWAEHCHVVVRGISQVADGATALPLALAFGDSFLTYGPGCIVRDFRMSPWRKGASHRLNEGEFHTDFSTSVLPPAVTAIVCLEMDPGGPAYGQNRVASLPRLRAQLTHSGEMAALDWLERTEVPLANDVTLPVWRGRLVQDGLLRYHPETVEAGCRGTNLPADTFQHFQRAIREAAMTVSVPFVLGRGDVLFVSNHRALHYRGECSVRFIKYPSAFESRRIAVFHLISEFADEKEN